MQQHDAATLELTVRDATRQKQYKIGNLETDWSVGDLVNDLVSRMGLVSVDSEGRPHTYQAFHEGEKRHLNPSGQVGDVLKTGDEIILQPNVAAGMC